MRMWWLISLALFLIAAFGFNGCHNKPTTLPPTNAPPTLYDGTTFFTPTAKIQVTSMVIGRGQAHFEGTTELYNATLETQLYQDGKPLDWWPATQDIKANGYIWEITVTFTEDLPVEYNYLLKIWYKDNPSLYGGYTFDLRGPPP